MWEKRKVCTLGDGTDASRADMFSYATWAWPPNDQVRTWLDEGWAKWETEKPEW